MVMIYCSRFRFSCSAIKEEDIFPGFQVVCGNTGEQSTIVSCRCFHVCMRSSGGIFCVADAYMTKDMGVQVVFDYGQMAQ